MKNISKRIACVVLSLLCVFMSTYTVYADNSGESNWEHLSNGHVVVNGVEYEPMEENQVMHELSYIANKLGVVGKILKGTANFGMSIEILFGTGAMVRDDAGNIYMKTDRKTEDGDNIKFSSDYVNGVRNGIADIIETQDGYVFIPTYKPNILPSYYFESNSAYQHYLEMCSKATSSYCIGSIDTSSHSDYSLIKMGMIPIEASTSLVLYSAYVKGESEYTVQFYDADLHRFDANSFTYRSYSDDVKLWSTYSNYTYPLFVPDSNLFDRYGKERIFFTYSSDGRALKVFLDKSFLVKNRENHGVQNFYTSNTYNNYNVNNDNSITINKKVYNDTDYETINNNNYTTINNTVNKYYEKNNTTIDTSSIEDIIKKFQDDQAKRDQELLDKVEDNNNKTDEGNQINKETNEKLDKIYEILQQIAGSLSGGDSGGAGSDFDMNTLIQMLNNLQLSLDTMWKVDLKQIQSNLNTIVNDLKSDNADSKSILEDIYKTQQQILELQQANLNQNKTFFDSVIDYLKKITHALTAGNIIDTLDTLLNLKDDADGLSDFVDGIVGDIEPAVSLMKTKFPTSIPWDIIAVISVMACDPQTPRFEIPINIDIMGQKYEDVLVIDLEQFNRVARFGRALLSVMFTLWLLLVTKRLLYGGEA